MKRVFFVFLAVLFSTAIFAQVKTTDKVKTTRQLENTIKDKKEDKHEVGKDLTHLKIKSAVDDRKDVRRDKRRIHRKASHLKRVYHVKHPRIKAQAEVKREKETIKDKHP